MQKLLKAKKFETESIFYAAHNDDNDDNVGLYVVKLFFWFKIAISSTTTMLLAVKRGEFNLFRYVPSLAKITKPTTERSGD